MAGNTITVRFEHLHPEVRHRVANVREKRMERLVYSTAPTAAALTSSDTASSRLAMAGTGGVIWMANSGFVVRHSKEVGDSLARYGIVAKEHAGRYNLPGLATLRKTHPFMIVNRRGDLHFLKGSVVQRALARAQDTFLASLIPARKRVRY